MDSMIFSVAEGKKHNLAGKAVFNDSLLITDNLSNDVYISDHILNAMGKDVLLDDISFFFFCLEGHATILETGRRHVLGKGDVIMSVSEYSSTLESLSDDIKFMAVGIKTGYVIPSSSVINNPSLSRKLAGNPVCHLEKEDLRLCRGIYSVIKARTYSKTPGPLANEIIQGSILTLMNIIFNAHMQKQEFAREARETSRKEQLYRDFVALARKNFREQRNIDFYADRLFVTPRYLSRVVKEVCGNYASDCIDNLVLAAAKGMLARKDRTVLQVSEELNFSSPSLFTRFFKRETGYTPTEYQKLQG